MKKSLLCLFIMFFVFLHLDAADEKEFIISKKSDAYPLVEIKKISLKRDYTVVEVIIHSPRFMGAEGNEPTGRLHPPGTELAYFITDINFEKQYKLIKAKGLPFHPKFKTFDRNGQIVKFKLYFEKIDSSLKQFHIMEGGLNSKIAWDFYNISLEGGINKQDYLGTDFYKVDTIYLNKSTETDEGLFLQSKNNYEIPYFRRTSQPVFPVIDEKFYKEDLLVTYKFTDIIGRPKKLFGMCESRGEIVLNKKGDYISFTRNYPDLGVEVKVKRKDYTMRIYQLKSNQLEVSILAKENGKNLSLYINGGYSTSISTDEKNNLSDMRLYASGLSFKVEASAMTITRNIINKYFAGDYKPFYKYLPSSEKAVIINKDTYFYALLYSSFSSHNESFNIVMDIKKKAEAGTVFFGNGAGHIRDDYYNSGLHIMVGTMMNPNPYKDNSWDIYVPENDASIVPLSFIDPEKLQSLNNYLGPSAPRKSLLKELIFYDENSGEKNQQSSKYINQGECRIYVDVPWAPDTLAGYIKGDEIYADVPWGFDRKIGYFMDSSVYAIDELGFGEKVGYFKNEKVYVNIPWAFDKAVGYLKGKEIFSDISWGFDKVVGRVEGNCKMKGAGAYFLIMGYFYSYRNNLQK